MKPKTIFYFKILFIDRNNKNKQLGYFLSEIFKTIRTIQFFLSKNPKNLIFNPIF